MEAVLSNLWIDQGETTYFHRKWKGQVRPIFSLEMASFGGEMHFYVDWATHRRITEASFYAQYPEIELVEVEDYARRNSTIRKYIPCTPKITGTNRAVTLIR